ncbi:MAG TPA: tRNA epoxyqueuosine(34) reductase QueG [Luteitalea sp.]|nr:tRNA epoxyqueuosine(34) reductase QueG [Luteitalea sp.]
MFSIDALRAHALTLGFDLCGVAPVERVSRLEFLREWVGRGYAGNLEYVVRSVDARVDPAQVLPGAQSAIVTGTIYNTDAPLSRARIEPDVARIARYAWGEDYHEVLGRRQHLLLGWLKEHAGEHFEAVGYVDTGPIQEKALAAAAGLGWIGKHTCLINQELGSWLFLSVILTTLPLPAGAPVSDRCGTCTRCLDVCPTGAIVEPYVVDATRCLSYVTIESHQGVGEAERDWVGSQVYGCDLCQDVCPWNSDAAVTDDPVWVARPLWREATLSELWSASDEDLQASIRHSPMYRTKVWRLRRNLALAIAASTDARAHSALRAPRDPAVDTSFAHPVVVEHIAWALNRLNR